jgi:hypothetical protein
MTGASKTRRRRRPKGTRHGRRLTRLMRDVEDLEQRWHTAVRDVEDQEAQWHTAVQDAYGRHEDDENTGTMQCPHCNETMSVVRRSRRMTFAGWEPACIQVECTNCGFGGEHKPQ